MQTKVHVSGKKGSVNRKCNGQKKIVFRVK